MVQMASNHHLFPSSSSSLPEFSNHHQQFQIPSNNSTNPNLSLSSSSTSQTSTSIQQQQQTLKETSFSPLFSSTNKQETNKPLSPMSATALLQKAAQMGSTRSNTAPSFFAGPTMARSATSAASPPPSSSPLMIHQQINNNFNANLSRESQNLTPPSSVDVNSFQLNRSGLNPVQQMGLTRDFLGVSNEHQMSRPFLPQELARFAPLG